MTRTRALFVVVVAGALAQLANVACGPPCADDRCSLHPSTSPQITTVNNSKPKPPPPVASPGSGSAAPVAVGSGGPVTAGSGSAIPVMVGSGSAKPVGSGSAVTSGSGSTPPPRPPPPAIPLSNARWERWDGDQFKMHVISKGTYPANTKVQFELVKTPAKTPFVVTLLVKPAGANAASEGVWNDCPDGKIKCDSGGTKAHATKKAGQIMLQAGINWIVTSVTDDKGTLVTWTNNLSREVLAIRLLK